MKIVELLKESLKDPISNKISSTRFTTQQMVCLVWVVSIGSLILVAFGKDVSTLALGIIGILSGNGASNVWAAQKAKKGAPAVAPAVASKSAPAVAKKEEGKKVEKET